MPVTTGTRVGRSPVARDAVQGLTALVRRRVPASDVDDVTQTVLCDALAAPALPTEPSELRRFLYVVARNKIADFHRRAHRMPTAEAVDLPAAPPAVEARSLLRRVIDAVSPRDRETLQWLVREHDGEQLAEIASEVGLPAPTVRKRVSRLRRALRAQWAYALLAIVVVGAAGASIRHIASGADVGSITADPAADPNVRVLSLAQGRWHVAAGSSLSHATAGGLDPSGVELRIEGRRIDIRATVAIAARTVESTRLLDERTFLIALRDDRGRVQHATVVIDGDALVVTFGEGALRGRARLVR